MGIAGSFRGSGIKLNSFPRRHPAVLNWNFYILPWTNFISFRDINWDVRRSEIEKLSFLNAPAIIADTNDDIINWTSVYTAFGMQQTIGKNLKKKSNDTNGEILRQRDQIAHFLRFPCCSCWNNRRYNDYIPLNFSQYCISPMKPIKHFVLP